MNIQRPYKHKIVFIAILKIISRIKSKLKKTKSLKNWNWFGNYNDHTKVWEYNGFWFKSSLI